MLKRLALIIAILLIPALAKADSTWNYAGNGVGDIKDYPLFNDPNGLPIDGTVTFASTPVPYQQGYPTLSFSFTQGGYTFNNSNSVLSIDPFGFSGAPNVFVEWDFSVFDFSGDVLIRSVKYDVGESTDSGPVSSEQGAPGTWTLVSTPEPGSLLLLGVG
jgi:hypothetical protein